MKLNTKQFAKETAIAAGVAYIFCTIFVVLFPSFSVQLIRSLTHIRNIEPFEVSFMGIIGLIQVLSFTYISAWVFSMLFNRAGIR